MHTTLHTASFALGSHPLQHNPTHPPSSRKHKTLHDPLHNHEYHSKQTCVTPPNSAVQSPFHKLEGSEKSYRDTWIVSKMVSLDDVVAAG